MSPLDKFRTLCVPQNYVTSGRTYVRALVPRPSPSPRTRIVRTRNTHAHILPRAGHGIRTYVPSPDHTSLRMRACITHTRGTPRTHACMCTHTRVTFRPESKSDLGSCETMRSNAINRVSHAPSLRYAPSARVRLAYTVYARARTRLSACACAGYAYSYAPAQMTERTYVHTYIRISRE